MAYNEKRDVARIVRLYKTDRDVKYFVDETGKNERGVNRKNKHYTQKEQDRLVRGYDKISKKKARKVF